eukprot:COSAG02_NODE_645_length_18947_cov_517.858712_11_plen_83_part_00
MRARPSTAIPRTGFGLYTRAQTSPSLFCTHETHGMVCMHWPCSPVLPFHIEKRESRGLGFKTLPPSTSASIFLAFAFPLHQD